MSSAVRAVSRFEANLLRLLRAIVRPNAGDVPQPAGRLAMPPGLSADCLHLVRDALSKGCMSYLARSGGWRRERHVRGGQPVEGRLWERTVPGELKLNFSRHAVGFLMWLTAGRPRESAVFDPPAEELTVADRFLLFLAYAALRHTDAQSSLRANSHFGNHALVWLMFPQDFAGTAPLPLDYSPWVVGVGGAIVEALQPRLLRRWLELERAKSQIADWAKLRGIGQSQDAVLSAFLSACQAAERPDLARFLLKSLSELLSPDLTPRFWLEGLTATDAPRRLAERLDAQRQGLAVLPHVERLAGWTRAFAGTPFYSDDYAIAQLWLRDWEEYCGEELSVIARNLLRQLEPLNLGLGHRDLG